VPTNTAAHALASLWLHVAAGPERIAREWVRSPMVCEAFSTRPSRLGGRMCGAAVVTPRLCGVVLLNDGRTLVAGGSPGLKQSLVGGALVSTAGSVPDNGGAAVSRPAFDWLFPSLRRSQLRLGRPRCRWNWDHPFHVKRVIVGFMEAHAVRPVSPGRAVGRGPASAELANHESGGNNSPAALRRLPSDELARIAYVPNELSVCPTCAMRVARRMPDRLTCQLSR
jgi:hypothetical protein